MKMTKKAISLLLGSLIIGSLFALPTNAATLLGTTFVPLVGTWTESNGMLQSQLKNVAAHEDQAAVRIDSAIAKDAKDFTLEFDATISIVPDSNTFVSFRTYDPKNIWAGGMFQFRPCYNEVKFVEVKDGGPTIKLYKDQPYASSNQDTDTMISFQHIKVVVAGNIVKTYLNGNPVTENQALITALNGGSIIVGTIAYPAQEDKGTTIYKNFKLTVGSQTEEYYKVAATVTPKPTNTPATSKSSSVITSSVASGSSTASTSSVISSGSSTASTSSVISSGISSSLPVSTVSSSSSIPDVGDKNDGNGWVVPVIIGLIVLIGGGLAAYFLYFKKKI